MLYFSELAGKKIYTDDDIFIGTLHDFIFDAGGQPRITKIRIKKKDKKGKHVNINVPMKYVLNINSSIKISKYYEQSETEEEELYVLKNIMDQQIIDISGNKVVRVNDVVVQDKDKPAYYIAGVDTGLIGILRWLKLNGIVEKAGISVRDSFLSWGDFQPLELSRGKIVLKHEQDNLKKMRPEDLADHLEKTNISNISKLIDLLDEEFAAEVIENLNISYQIALFKQLSAEKAAKVIELIDADEGADILLALSDKYKDKILQIISPQQRKKIQYLLDLSTTPIGEVLITDVFTVKPHDVASSIIDRIRSETKDFYSFNAVYVTNNQDQLIGVFNIHELLLNSFDTPVYKFMIQNVIVVHLKTPKEIALKKMLKYKIRTLPVINDEKKILGVITVEDLINSLEKFEPV